MLITLIFHNNNTERLLTNSEKKSFNSQVLFFITIRNKFVDFSKDFFIKF